MSTRWQPTQLLPVAATGQTLLVTNEDVHPKEIPEHWKVLSGLVGERRLPQAPMPSSEVVIPTITFASDAS